MQNNVVIVCKTTDISPIACTFYIAIGQQLQGGTKNTFYCSLCQHYFGHNGTFLQLFIGAEYLQSYKTGNLMIYMQHSYIKIEHIYKN